MKPFRLVRCATWLAAGALVAGCGHKYGDDHDHGKDDSHSHSHGEESPSGASFKPGKGVSLTDETRKILGVEIADLSERRLPNQIRFTVQVFRERHHHAPRETPPAGAFSPVVGGEGGPDHREGPDEGEHSPVHGFNARMGAGQPPKDDDHSGCDVHGSGFVSIDTAGAVKAGQPVQLFKDTNNPATGVVLAVQKALALGEAEIVIGVSNASAAIKPGEFVPARITVPRDGTVSTIPQAALLRTLEGTFVYVVNGDAYYKTAVKVGAEADGWVEIIDGLLAGDQVVTKPVQTLWLIELRATKGGGHSH